MKIRIKECLPQKHPHACLIVGVFDDLTMTKSAAMVDKTSRGQLIKRLKQAGFQGQPTNVLPVFGLATGSFEMVLVVGCGKASTMTVSRFRTIMSNATKSLLTYDIDEAICYLTDLNVERYTLPWKVKQLAEVAQNALYRFDTYKSKKDPKVRLGELTINLPTQAQAKACDKAFKQGIAIASGMAFTKDLANTPSNVCTPTYLAKQAIALGKTYRSLKVNVLDEKAMRKLGMGALLAVSQGSAEEAKLICLEYQGAAKSRAPIALIGKGITFDSGGNSLKSPDNMVGMKYDMCGAATVLGTIKAAAELKLPINIVGVIAAVENMPGGTAYKPEDILTSMSGQTIEVISTDAEGRLVLADALTYCERFKPDTVIDIATLTGAVVIALGFHASGLLTNHEPLAQALLKAGLESGDRAWQLPMYDEHQEQIKSPFADMANTGGRPAGTITAACFLSRFASKFHWAHLDVAGTAAMMMGGSDRYATGRPVPLLMQYLLTRAKQEV